jgi:hypothetical protein
VDRDELQLGVQQCGDKCDLAVMGDYEVLQELVREVLVDMKGKPGKVAK